MGRKTLATLCLAITGALSSVGAHGDTESLAALPLATRNLQPLAQISGLPAAAPARLVTPGTLELRLAEEPASHFTLNARADEAILLDGESYRTTLALRWGLAPRWQLGLELYYLDHTPGYFDGLINAWHAAFDLPDGNRSDFPKERLIFNYRRGTETLLDIRDSRAGAGDLRVLVDYGVLQGARALALQVTRTVPTARGADLLGSGAATTSLALNWHDSASLASWQSAWYAGVGQLWRARGGALPRLQRRQATFGYVGIAYGWTPRVTLKLQLDGHSALYRSALTELGRSALQLGVGGSLRLARRGWLELAAIEDVKVDTAPDIALHIGWRQAW